MPAYVHDDRFVDPEQVGPPNVASVLLIDLGVDQKPASVQMAAVVDWLAEHRPSPALLASLRRAGFLPAPAMRASDRWVRRKAQRRWPRAARVGDVIEVRHKVAREPPKVIRGEVVRTLGQPGRQVIQVRTAGPGGRLRTFRVPSAQVGHVRVVGQSQGVRA